MSEGTDGPTGEVATTGLQETGTETGDFLEESYSHSPIRTMGREDGMEARVTVRLLGDGQFALDIEDSTCPKCATWHEFCMSWDTASRLQQELWKLLTLGNTNA